MIRVTLRGRDTGGDLEIAICGRAAAAERAREQQQ